MVLLMMKRLLGYNGWWLNWFLVVLDDGWLMMVAEEDD
jgi:hypothetical protein